MQPTFAGFLPGDDVPGNPFAEVEKAELSQEEMIEGIDRLEKQVAMLEKRIQKLENLGVRLPSHLQNHLEG